MGQAWHAFIKSILQILLKSQTQLPSHFCKKEGLLNNFA